MPALDTVCAGKLAQRSGPELDAYICVTADELINQLTAD